MLLASQPLGFQNQQMNSLLRPKMTPKMAMINSTDTSHRNRQNHSDNPPNGLSSPPMRNQRKIRTANEVLKSPPPQVQVPSREFQKHQEEIRNKCVQETQQSEGCFATIMESSHLNFVIPCIPMHLSSIHPRNTNADS